MSLLPYFTYLYIPLHTRHHFSSLWTYYILLVRRECKDTHEIGPCMLPATESTAQSAGDEHTQTERGRRAVCVVVPRRITTPFLATHYFGVYMLVKRRSSTFYHLSKLTRLHITAAMWVDRRKPAHLGMPVGEGSNLSWVQSRYPSC